VKVRITRKPVGTWDGVPLKEYLPGNCYDVSRSIGDYLILCGYAVLERRQTQRTKESRPQAGRRSPKV